MSPRPLLAAALLAALPAAPASAGFTVYTDEAAFDAALSGATLRTEGFESAGTGSLGRTFGDLTVVDINNGDFPRRSGTYASEASCSLKLGRADGRCELAGFDFAAPVNAFAFDVLDLGTAGATDFGLRFGLPGLPTVTLLDDFSAYRDFGNVQFVGVISTTAFRWLDLLNTNKHDVVYLDRVRFGHVSDPGGVGAGSSVPEPASLLLFGLGVAGLLAGRRRRTRR